MSATLYICGNGFDLNHGLPTSYKHYRKFLFLRSRDVAESYERLVKLLVPEEQPWKNIESSLFLDFASLWDEIAADEGVLDDEKTDEYGEIECDKMNFSDSFELKINEHTAFIKDFIDVNFRQWVNSISLVGLQPKDSIAFEPDSLILTFNYTETIEALYGVPQERILHIHGTRDERLQFGTSRISPQQVDAHIQREYATLPQYTGLLSVPHSDYVDDVKTCFKDVKANFSRLQHFLEGAQIEKVVVMGFSFGIDDMPYFDDLIFKQYRAAHWSFRCHLPSDSAFFNRLVQEKELSDFELVNW